METSWLETQRASPSLWSWTRLRGDGSGIQFRAMYTQRALEGLIQDTRFEVLEPPLRDMTRFIGALIGTHRAWMHKAFM